jgi:hypothetical protein
MLIFRALALAVALALAAAVNVFLAPQIYSPRAPAFSGADLAANEAWKGHAFSFQPSWLAHNLPHSTFVNTRIGQPDWVGENGFDVGILWNTRTVVLEDLAIDDSEFPLDLSNLSIRDDINRYHQHSAQIRCQSDPIAGDQTLCDYFVAFDDSVDANDRLTFVGVFTVTGSDTNEVGFIEKNLLERLIGGQLESVPTIGAKPE